MLLPPIDDEAEIGALWELHHQLRGDYKSDQICRLIKKMVNDRAKLKRWRNGDPVEQALRDFHIDPKTWEEVP